MSRAASQLRSMGDEAGDPHGLAATAQALRVEELRQDLERTRASLAGATAAVSVLVQEIATAVRLLDVVAAAQTECSTEIAIAVERMLSSAGLFGDRTLRALGDVGIQGEDAWGGGAHILRDLARAGAATTAAGG